MGAGAAIEVGVHESIEGLYRPPSFVKKRKFVVPPQTIISVPVHTAVCRYLGTGTFAPSEVAAQESVTGLYRPPVLTAVPAPPASGAPPQTIISVPVQTAVGYERPAGTPAAVEVGVHESVEGLYRPPVFTLLLDPPQTIISVPVHTAACW
jgi:hypothetical protein